jgi:hypothetical protein
MTSRNTWKAGERRVAAVFGTERTPLSGGNSKHTRSDTLHDKLFIEIKMRARQAVWTLFRETEVLARKEDKIPVLALQEKHKPGFLLVMRPEDIRAVVAEMETAP